MDSENYKDIITINEDNGIPIWLQLRNRLIYLILRGKFKVGEQLPTVRELAVELGINYNTVSKVYQDIERDGYIVSKRGKGTFVAEYRSRENSDKDKESFVTLFEEFIRQCDELGIPKHDLTTLMNEYLESKES